MAGTAEFEVSGADRFWVGARPFGINDTQPRVEQRASASRLYVARCHLNPHRSLSFVVPKCLRVRGGRRTPPSRPPDAAQADEVGVILRLAKDAAPGGFSLGNRLFGGAVPAHDRRLRVI